MNNALVEKVRETIARYRMIERGDTVIVAVSGGADSVALLHVLNTLRDELDMNLVVAHMNHCIRGADSDQDALFVEALSTKLGIPYVIETTDVPAIRKQMHVGIEEAARKVRYDFLEQVAKSCDAKRVAVAHTADDQAETVLLNIIRGAGLEGLSRMPYVRGRIIRPLMEISKSQVEAYLKENGLAWRVDESNLDQNYARNRVRHRLVPLLRDEFNPRVKEALVTLSKLACDESDIVSQAAQGVFESTTKEVGPKSVIFDADMLAGNPRAIQRRCIRMAIEIVKGDLRDVEYVQVERIIDCLEYGEEFTLTLPSGKVYAGLSCGNLAIFRRVSPKKVEVEREINLPGKTEVPELGVMIVTDFASRASRPETLQQAVIDSAKIVGKLVVRTWRTGERMSPLGMVGSKKLQDIFIDKKIPQSRRGLIPIISDQEKIVWIAGVTVSEQVKIDDATLNAVLIECKSLV